MSNLAVIEKLMIRLLQTNVFYASLLTQMRRIETDKIPTEAVAIKNGRIEFYYNPKFLETLTLDEATAVLQHECNHLVLGHCVRMRDEYKENSMLANISQDMNANKDIHNLPKGACTVDSITKEFASKGIKVNLKSDDTSENYYKELNKHSNKMEIKADGEGNYDVTIKDPNGKVIGKFKVKAICDNKPNSESDGGDIPELAKEVIRQAIKEAVDQTNRQQGHLPAGMEEAINEWLKPPTISWKQLLKKFIAASIKAGHKMSWKRPNRRFGEQQKGSIPDRMIQITVAVDTSGSINEEDFQAFIAEMRAIQSCYKGTITVLECDADIQKEYKLTKYGRVQHNFKGRGGTSFKPVFEHIQKKKIKTDVLVFFTDLYGDQEQCKKPSYPVIWVSTTEKQRVPFGWVISLVSNPDKKKLSLTGK